MDNENQNGVTEVEGGVTVAELAIVPVSEDKPKKGKKGKKDASVEVQWLAEEEQPGALLLDPRRVKLDWSQNHSRSSEETRAGLEPLIRSMVNRQLQPVLVMKLEGDPNYTHQVYVGFRRTLAAKYIVEEGIDPSFRLKANQIDGLSREEVIAANLQENVNRKNMNAADYLKAVLWLTDKPATDDNLSEAPDEDAPLGLTTAQAADFLGVDSPWIALFKKVPKVLDKDEMETWHKAVAKGMSLRTSVDVVKFPAERRHEFLKSIAAGKKVSHSDLKREYRKLNDEKAEAGEKPVKTFTMSVKEIKTHIKVLGLEDQPVFIADTFKDFLDLITGNMPEKQFHARLKKRASQWLIPGNDNGKPVVKVADLLRTANEE